MAAAAEVVVEHSAAYVPSARHVHRRLRRRNVRVHTESVAAPVHEPSVSGVIGGRTQKSGVATPIPGGISVASGHFGALYRTRDHGDVDWRGCGQVEHKVRGRNPHSLGCFSRV